MYCKWHCCQDINLVDLQKGDVGGITMTISTVKNPLLVVRFACSDYTSIKWLDMQGDIGCKKLQLDVEIFFWDSMNREIVQEK